MNKKSFYLLLVGTILLSFAFLAIGVFPVSAQGQSGTTLSATVSATNTYTRTYHWTISKTVSPTAFNMFRGDSGTANYIVSVTKDAGIDALTISGQVCVTNGGAVATENLAIVANVSMPPSQAVVASTPVDLSANVVIAAGATACYNYSITIPTGSIVAGANYKVTADITITDHSGHLGTPFGPNPSADTLTAVTPTAINGSVNVDDTNGSSWAFSASGSQSYSKTFTCDTDQGSHNNTATIRETQQSASASVQVNCYVLGVSKTAVPTFTRTYNWSLAKSVSPQSFDLFAGETAVPTYTITATKTGFVDSAWAVSGLITINNPAPMVATINSVADVISSGPAPAPVCGVTFPYTLAAGGSLTCSYEASLPDGTARINTATATLQNTPSGTTDFSGTASIAFVNPTSKVNDTVTLTDTRVGSSKQISDTYVWTYTLQFPCPTDLSEYTNGKKSFILENTASITETGATATASFTKNCYALSVSKTANTSLTRTHNWDIHKTASPDSLSMFAGANQNVQYAVTVDYLGSTDSNWAVSGTITVTNPAPIDATLDVALADSLSGVGAVTLNPGCGYVVPAIGKLTCDYTAALPDAAPRLNTATAVLKGIPYTGNAAVSFANTTVNDVNKTINITDSNNGSGGPWTLTAVSGTFKYTLPFDCSTNIASYTNGLYGYKLDNTATITETSQHADETVNVQCYAPLVSKTAQTSFDRNYYWKISKAFNPTTLKLAINQVYTVGYTVIVGLDKTVDANFKVNGAISIHNPNETVDMFVNLTDVLTSGDAVTLTDCTNPVKVPANEDKVCQYTASLAAKTDGTNTATATIVSTGAAFNATAPVDFSKATITEFDETATVTDTLFGSLGQLSIIDLPKTFTYSYTVGPYATCGNYTVNNIAMVTGDESHISTNATASIAINVPCTGCTLTIGYWKTHAGFGPQKDMLTPLLPIWLGTPGGAKSINVSSALTAVNLLSFSGDASNGINKLYGQLLGAKLNIAKGADGSAVSAIIGYADAFLATHSAADWSALTKTDKNKVNSWMSTLDQYNNGLTGPGHCSQ